MKAKDIVKHKITNEVGFIMCIRKDKIKMCDIQWSFKVNDNIDYKDQCLINQGCYSFEELEVVYSI